MQGCTVEFPKIDGQRISEQPEDVIQRILDLATLDVGVARLNEMLAIITIHNLRALVMLQFLCDDVIDFANDRYIRPPEMLSEEDLIERQDGEDQVA